MHGIHKFIIIFIFVLTGCSSNIENSLKHIVLATPEQITLQQQIQLTKINQTINTTPTTSKLKKAQLFYTQGLLLDSIGLKDLAQISFRQSLFYDYNQPELYNLIGVYLTQKKDFSLAYQSFNSALDLDPQDVFAKRNFGISLYYGKRFTASLKWLNAAIKQDPDDAYAVIWRYLSQLKIDEKKALSNLKMAYLSHEDQQGGWELISIFLFPRDINKLLNSYQQEKDDTYLAEHLCEAYFYLGKREQLLGHTKLANQFFKLSLSTNVQEYIEYRFALIELNKG